MSTPVETEIAARLADDCGGCAERLRDELARHPGVRRIDSSDRGRLRVSYDPDLCSDACLDAAAAEARAVVTNGFAHEQLQVRGMDCADCARTIERAVVGMEGVSFAALNFATAKLQVEYEPDRVTPDRLAERVRSLGYAIAGDDRGGGRRRRRNATAIAAGLVLAAVSIDLAGGPTLLAHAVYAVAIVLAGLPIARAGWIALRTTRRPDMNVLMAAGAIGAAAIGAWLEASLVVLLFSVGQALESRAVDRARRELESLVALSPETARVRTVGAGGAVIDLEIPAADLRVDDLVLVRPGERVAADGVVAEGSSALDESAITGESVPVDRVPGGRVFAGSLNGQGALTIRVDAEPGDSTLARIGRLVTEAKARRSPSERWVDGFARWYTPLVMLAAVIVATVPALAGAASWDASIYDGLALLILACPCALVISTPVSIVSALGRASAAGVLVKGGEHLEAAAAIDTVAFDKTGTLTTGRPRLTTIEPVGGMTDDAVLRIAASVERSSEHPLATAIVSAARERRITLAPVTEFTAMTGVGATGTVDGATVVIGNARVGGPLLDEVAERSMTALEHRGETAVAVVRDGVALGLLGISDTVRPEAAESVAMLTALGVHRTVMLTGDNERTARSVASGIGLTTVRASLLPEEKARAVEGLGGCVMMVGDGVNDAPALAAARVGVAMGSAGSDTAIEVADVALLGDDPRKVAGLIGLARFTRSVVRQNIAFSLATKLVAAGFLAFSALPLWAAVASDVGASLIVVANGLRLLRGTPRAGSLRGAPMLAAAPRHALASAQDRGALIPAPRRALPVVAPAPPTADTCCDHDCCRPEEGSDHGA